MVVQMFDDGKRVGVAGVDAKTGKCGDEGLSTSRHACVVIQCPEEIGVEWDGQYSGATPQETGRDGRPAALSGM